MKQLTPGPPFLPVNVCPLNMKMDLQDMKEAIHYRHFTLAGVLTRVVKKKSEYEDKS